MRDFDYSRHYARFHQFSENYYALMASSYQKFFEGLLPPDKNAPILDVGCGAGFALNAIRKAGYTNARGIDADRGQVKIAKGRALPVELISAENTTEFLCRFRGAFQAVILLDVLEHVPKDEAIQFLRSICDALAPGGVLLCQVPNALWVLGCYNRYVDWTHECSFTTQSLMFVLENSGFVTEDIRPGHRTPSPPRGRFLSLAVPALAKLLQWATSSMWRLFVVSNLGLERGVRHPISPDLLAIARKADPV